MKFPLRDDLPKPSTFTGPADSLSALLDAAAELGKVTPDEVQLMDALPLSMAYASLTGFLDTVRVRRGKGNT